MRTGCAFNRDKETQGAIRGSRARLQADEGDLLALTENIYGSLVLVRDVDPSLEYFQGAPQVSFTTTTTTNSSRGRLCKTSSSGPRWMI